MKRLFFSASMLVGLSSCGASSTTIAAPEEVEMPSGSGTGDEPTTGDGVIALDVVVDGRGTVRSEPAGIDCPGHCSATFEPGREVKLTLTASEGWKLGDGGGVWAVSDDLNACRQSATTCSVVLQSDTKVTSTLKQIDPRWDPSVGIGDCNDAWGQAGEKLSPCDTTPDDYVVVHKSKRNVALCKNGALVKNLRSGLGFTPTGSKEKQGDGKTPEGVFYVPRLVPNSSYYKAFLISYPTPDDAERGVNSGLITKNERAQIESAHDACTEPSQSTSLGGEIELHGNGSSEDWTHGCVAVDDAGIDLLWSTIGVHDTIVVLP